MMTSRGCAILVLTVIVVDLQLFDADAAAARDVSRHRLRRQASELDQPPVSTAS